MVTYELIEFVKEHLERGTSHEEITQVLRAQGGWKEEHIEHALFLAQYGHHVVEDNQLLD